YREHFPETSRHRGHADGVARPLPGGWGGRLEEPRGGCGRRRKAPAEVRRGQRERRQRTAAREDRSPGGRPPFGILEVETVSRTVSPSSKQPYGVARVTLVWDLARSSFYAARQRQLQPAEPNKRGPKVHSDEALVGEIRQLLAEPVFTGEG